jgi:hypothetical protein
MTASSTVSYSMLHSSVVGDLVLVMMTETDTGSMVSLNIRMGGKHGKVPVYYGKSSTS